MSVTVGRVLKSRPLMFIRASTNLFMGIGVTALRPILVAGVAVLGSKLGTRLLILKRSVLRVSVRVKLTFIGLILSAEAMFIPFPLPYICITMSD